MSHFVKEYYNAHAEQEQQRLDLPLCRIEFASTLWLINKYFPGKGRVCDVGGGTGRYTLELLRKGYQVTLFDLSDEEIRLAGLQLQEQGLSAERLIVGDARNMDMLASASFHAVLLLGPLYHILDPAGRAQVLQEVKRILKPQGVAIIAYLNSWGLIKTGLQDFPQRYRDISSLRLMLEAQDFLSSDLSGFTECHWSTPVAAQREIREAGLEIVSYAGAEGFANGMGLLLEKLLRDDQQAYENILQVAAETCELAQYRDSTDHLHLIARKAEL